ncbi:MAG: hypothetical protein SFW65_00175 [Alphaproteobacteria bacterium]|nr:hypothetical protein [Alphaproteobacteria bacterium]
MTSSPLRMVRIVTVAAAWSLTALGIASAQQATEERGNIEVMAIIPVDCKLDDAALAEVLAEKLGAFLTAENESGTLGIKKGPVAASVFPAAMLAYLRENGHADMDVSTRARFQRGPRFQCIRGVS